MAWSHGSGRPLEMDGSAGIPDTAGRFYRACAIGLGSPWDLISGPVVPWQFDRRADYFRHPRGLGSLDHVAAATILAAPYPKPSHASHPLGRQHSIQCRSPEVTQP